jgi:uncharacterized protein (TIRG00374 family)
VPVVVAVGGIAVLAHTIDARDAVQRVAQADLRWTLLGVLLTALSLLSSIFAWGVLLRGVGHRLRWRALSRWYLLGVFLGQVVPTGAAGDALRAVEVGKVTGHGHALASLAGSRMAGALGITMWGLAGALLLRERVGPLVVAGACVLAAGMVLVWVLALTADHVVPRLMERASPLPRRALSMVRPFTRAFGSYGRRPSVIVLCVAASSIAWGINLGALTAFARAVGLDAGWSPFAVIIPVTLVASLAPFSLNGVGLREGVLVSLLGHAGVGGGHAAALSILIDLQMIPFVLLGAGVWLFRGRSWPAMRPGRIAPRPSSPA